jgi:KDO2-lipid IV(A) lauroyltransferase
MDWSARALRHELGYQAMKVLLAGARVVPLPTLRAFGAAAARLLIPLFPSEIAKARAHLVLAFPERDERWREETLAACRRHLGVLVGEVAWLWSARPAQVLERTQFVGFEHLTSALAAGTGVVLATGHVGNWEWLNLSLGAAGIPISAAAREIYDPRLDQVSQRLRGRFGGETVLRGENAGKRLLQALYDGRCVGLLIDQDIDAPGAFVEFFGHPAWTPTGAAFMALRAGSPAITAFAVRLPNGSMRVTVKPVALTSTGDTVPDSAASTAAITAEIEQAIRTQPAQWVWMHHRWRRQPAAGEKVWSVPPVPPADAGASLR